MQFFCTEMQNAYTHYHINKLTLPLENSRESVMNYELFCQSVETLCKVSLPHQENLCNRKFNTKCKMSDLRRDFITTPMALS